MRYFLYKKKGRVIIPVEEPSINVQARQKLDSLLKEKDKLGIPARFIAEWDNVALFHSNGELEKANAIMFPKEKSAFALNNTLNDLTAKEWLPETVSVFSQKGLGANHKNAQIEKQHPAPFSYQDVGRLIQFYTKENHKILDPFSGVASTVKACAVNNRLGYGIELNPKYHELGIERINTEVDESNKYKHQQKLILGDSIEQIKQFNANFFDFIVTSPPYWNILNTVDHKNGERVKNGLDHKYSEAENDLANIIEYEDFLNELSAFFDACSKYLKKGKYMNIVVSDFRKKDKYYVFHADLAKKIEEQGNFKLKGIRILYQRHKSIYPYGYPFSFVPNLHHQNVLIFQNNK
jgi:DNA modification methylase